MEQLKIRRSADWNSGEAKKKRKKRNVQKHDSFPSINLTRKNRFEQVTKRNHIPIIFFKTLLPRTATRPRTKLLPRKKQFGKFGSRGVVRTCSCKSESGVLTAVFFLSYFFFSFILETGCAASPRVYVPREIDCDGCYRIKWKRILNKKSRSSPPRNNESRITIIYRLHYARFRNMGEELLEQFFLLSTRYKSNVVLVYRWIYCNQCE